MRIARELAIETTTNNDFIDQFGDKFIKPFDFHNSVVRPSRALAGKEIILLYFSAQWCPPCRQFTRVLTKLYQKLKRKRRRVNMEVVFCSLDYDRKDYDECISSMPWLCMPFQSILSKKLAKIYNAKGIPHLVVIDGKDNYSVITSDAIDEIRIDKGGRNFPWRPKTFEVIWPNRIHAPPISSSSTTDISSRFVESESLRNKYLMLYFSASWCPPSSRQISAAILSEIYTKIKSERDDFELVYVSSDQNEQSFEEFFTNNMTFCALPYIFRDAHHQLTKKFQVKSIPTLVMLGPMNTDTNERPLINPDVRDFVKEENDDTSNVVSDFPFHIRHYGSIDRADLKNERCLLLFHENGSEMEQKKVKEVAKHVGRSEQLKIYWSLNRNSKIGAKARSVLNMPEASSSTKPTMVLMDIPGKNGYFKSDTSAITVESFITFMKEPGKCWQLPLQ